MKLQRIKRTISPLVKIAVQCGAFFKSHDENEPHTLIYVLSFFFINFCGFLFFSSAQKVSSLGLEDKSAQLNGCFVGEIIEVEIDAKKNKTKKPFIIKPFLIVNMR